MAYVISLGNQKGGVGKTTLTINLAGYFAKKGKKVLVIDADQQETALTWHSIRQDTSLFDIVGIPEDNIDEKVETLSLNYDYILIDCPPHSANILKSIIVSSDFFIIPLNPSALDVWSSESVVKLLEQAVVYKENIKSAFVINRKIVNTAIGDAIKKVLKNYSIPLLKTIISQRVSFAESMSSGLLVYELNSDKQAVLEIENLGKEIEKYVKKN